MVCNLRDKELFSKVKIFHLIFAYDIKAGVIINDEEIFFLVKKILWIRCQPWFDGFKLLVLFGYLESYEIRFLDTFHEFL
jgi:hypothetical protein